MKFRIESLQSLSALIKELATGLRNLNFGDNFQGEEKEVVIPATSEAQIRHSLTSIPTKYIILLQEGNGLVTKGTTAWDSNHIYLYNNGASEVTITLQILP